MEKRQRDISRVRDAIIDEQEAIRQYQDAAAESENATLKKVFDSIAAEEMIHVGELMALLKTLSPDDGSMMEQGFREAGEMIGDGKK